MKARRRIALDARISRQLSVGMRSYVRELTQRLPRIAPDFEFLIFDEGANFGFAEQIGLPVKIARAKPALSHFLSQYTPLVIPRPYVVTIHDLIHLLFPKNFKRKVGPYYRSLVRFVCARAQRVITDDDRTVADLQRFLGVPAEKVRVIPLGVDARYLAPADPYRGERPYFLYAGNHRAHKDLPTLFRAWSSLPEGLAVDLAITGDDDFGDGLKQYARQNGRLITLGTITEDELARRYAGALALVHPALREGFGFPMLEAMAARCPVIACSDALPGVLRGAALTFAAGDANAARDAMQQLLAGEGLRAQLVNEGRARAERLTWDRCAHETAQVYREVLAEK